MQHHTCGSFKFNVHPNSSIARAGTIYGLKATLGKCSYCARDLVRLKGKTKARLLEITPDDLLPLIQEPEKAEREKLLRRWYKSVR